MTTGYDPSVLEVLAPRLSLPAAEARPWWVAAVQVLLFRLTQQESIALDVEVVDAATGATTLSQLDAVVSGEEPFATLVEVAGRALAEKAQLPSERSRAANVMVCFVSPSMRRVRSSADLRADAGHDLRFVIHEEELGSVGAPRVELAYNRYLVTVETAERWRKAFLLSSTTGWNEPSRRVQALPLMDEGDTQKLRLLLDGATSVAAPELFLASFRRAVVKHPDKIAAVFRHARLTYRALDDASEEWAARMRRRGVGPGINVAVCVPASVDILVAMLAIFKAGGVYVPLDPSHPSALIQGILAEARPRLVLSSSVIAPVTSPETFEHWYLDLPWLAEDVVETAAAAASVSASLPTAEQAAYILYTSGTTGRPKGVVATHGNLAQYLEVARGQYGFFEGDVFCSLARYTFSISLFELLSPMACGGTIRLLERDEILVPQNLARELASVTVVHAGPSLLSSLFRHLRSDPTAPRSFPGIRHASSGGDMVPAYLLEEMKQVFPRAEIFVIYGCTEISCMGCTFPVSRAETITKSYVGRPFTDVTVRLLDAHQKLVPIGVVGEICFSGAGVVQGYWERPELNEEKFILLEGRRYYRTGDMGRVHADGLVEILGRRDFQVQLRGIRIELAGIENTVRSLGWAAQCAVVLKTLDEHDTRLVAFVVKPRETRIGALRQALAAHLPDYMLPQGMVVLDALPVTANGKVDRQRLQALPWDNASTEGSEKAAPRNAIERRIADAFGHALGVEGVGLDDDFFDLGGHSLTAVVLMQELENILGLSLSPGLLFERSTVRGLAEHAEQAFPSAPRPILLAGSPESPPLFLLLGVHLYRPLAQRLGRRYGVYSVYAGRELVVFEESGKAPAVADLARDYIEIIRRQQPSGPYRVAGMSFGGILAFEVAQQLEAQGERVIFLGLLDSILPEMGAGRYWSVARRLWSLPRGEALRLVTRRLMDRGLSLLTRRRAYKFVSHTEDDRLRALEERREDAYREATEAYLGRVRSWTGDAALAVAGRRLAEDPLQSNDCGWSSHLPRLQIQRVDADHLTMLQEPRVEEVAKLFLNVLSRADKTAPLPEVVP